MRSPYFPHI